MKLVDTELQNELLNFLQKKKDGTWTAEDGSYDYFLEQFRPKRTRKKESHESVIEDAYKEHTGQI